MVSVNMDHSFDHLCWDNIQTITVRTYRNGVDTDTQTDFAFDGGVMTLRDQTMFGVHNLTGKERMWTVAALDLDTAGQEIRKGDKIAIDAIADIDSATVWFSVKQVLLLNDDSEFSCVCIKDRV